MTATNEKVQFRLLAMPCCAHQLCWVNPRLPSYCPACGAAVYQRLRTEAQHTLIDSPGWLRVGDAPAKRI